MSRVNYCSFLFGLLGTEPHFAYNDAEDKLDQLLFPLGVAELPIGEDGEFVDVKLFALLK